MILKDDYNVFVRNIVGIIAKGKELTMGTIINSTLFVIVNGGLLYEVDLSNYLDQSITCTFDKNSYEISRYEEPVLDKNGKECYDANGRLKVNVKYDYIFDAAQLQPEVLHKVDSILSYETDERLRHHVPNIREDFAFENIVNAKSGDGAFRFFVDIDNKRTFMYLYKNMFGLTKQDKIGLKVYDADINRYIACFNIHKQKIKLDIIVHFMFLDVVNVERIS